MKDTELELLYRECRCSGRRGKGFFDWGTLSYLQYLLLEGSRKDNLWGEFVVGRF